MTCARIDPSDVVQETHIVAVRRIDEFLKQRPTSFRLWLRTKALERLVEAPSPPCAEAIRRAGSVALKHLVTRDCPSRVSVASQLRPATTGTGAGRSAGVGHVECVGSRGVVAGHGEGLTNAEVAEVLGLDPDTASKRYGRAVRRLCERLRDGHAARGLDNPSQGDLTVADAQPETLESLDDLLGQVMGEVFDRMAAGEKPDLEAYVAKYPAIADLLRQALPPLMALSNTLLGSQALDADIDSTRQERLGDFRLVREIGRGGMGVVYEAEQLSMGRKVALKVLPFAAMLDPKALRRFQNEVRAAATLDHPHIVPVYSVGEDRGVHYYAMHLIKGPSLAALLEELRAIGRQSGSTATISSIDELVSEQTAGVARSADTASLGTSTDASDDVRASAETSPDAHHHNTLASRQALLSFHRGLGNSGSRGAPARP